MNGITFTNVLLPIILVAGIVNVIIMLVPNLRDKVYGKHTELYAKRLKKGFADGSVFCKHCGTAIDNDSAFCKKCGKEQ